MCLSLENEIDRVATPFVREAAPRVVLPEVKETFPVGGMTPVTVAVKVSCWVGAAVLAETASAVFEGNMDGAVGAGLV
jgi:hypothetical protein